MVKVIFVFRIEQCSVPIFPQNWADNIRRNSDHRNTDRQPMESPKTASFLHYIAFRYRWVTTLETLGRQK